MLRILILAALFAAAPALAQETVPTIPVPDLAPPSETSGATQLDDVVVTAQKVKQPLRRVPISVTALGGDFIAATGAADLADVSLYVPNVRVDADDLGSPQIFIRGFGTNAFNPSFEGSVAFVQDEIFFGRPGYFTEAMFDIDRVEVLRGPQGTLFGKNCVAGVFNVSSRGPEESLEANLMSFIGQQGEKRYEGGAGGMLTGWFGVRVAALKRNQAGDLYNTFLQRPEEALDQQAGRVRAVVYPGFGLKSEVAVVKSETEAPFWPLQLFKLDDDTRTFLQNYDPNVEDNPKDFRTEADTRGFIQKGSTTFSVKTDWDAGNLGPLHDLAPVLVLGSSKFHIDQLNELDVSPADIGRLDNHEHHEQTSAELRVAGHADSLFGLGTGIEFVTGAFYYKSNYILLAQILAGADLGAYTQTRDFCQLATGDQDATVGATGCNSNTPGAGVFGTPTASLVAGDLYRFDYDQDVSSLAYFGQFTWNVTEHIAVTPGVRLNREKKQVGVHGNSHCQAKDANGTGPCFMEQLLKAEDYNEAHHRSESDLSPKLALQYFAPWGVNFYTSYAKGYKSGGFNSIGFKGTHTQAEADADSSGNTTPHTLEYAPERAQTYEVGAKARMFENSVEVNLTGYHTRFQNLQVLAFNGFLFDVSNAGSAQSKGFEFDFRWLTPWQPLKIVGSAGLLDARYDSYPGAPAPISQGIGAKQDLAGQRIAFAPRQTATLTPQLTFLFGNVVTTLAGDVLYQGDQYTDTDLDPNTYQGAYTKYTARIAVSAISGLWSVALGGSNLTDERVLNQVTDASFFPGTYFAQQASGRQLFGTLTLHL